MSERRVHTWWLVRERYRRAAWLAALLGIGLAAVPVIMMVEAEGLQALASGQAIAGSLILLALGFFLPRWLVLALWRRQRARHLAEW